MHDCHEACHRLAGMGAGAGLLGGLVVMCAGVGPGGCSPGSPVAQAP